MNFKEIRNALINDRLKNIVDNVEETFTYPAQRAEQEGQFPYITMVFGLAVPDPEQSRLFKQTVSIIAIDKGDIEDIPDKVIDLREDIFNELFTKKEPKILVLEIDTSNLFKPFGLDAGLFPPYGGVRFECEIPYTVKRA